MADGGGGGGSGSAAMGSVSIGNYKGVMLCNRPFNGVSSCAYLFRSLSCSLC